MPVENYNRIGLVGFLAFSIVNAPSLKLILPSSSLTNIFLLSLLGVIALIRCSRCPQLVIDKIGILMIVFLAVSLILMVLPLIIIQPDYSVSTVFIYFMGLIYIVASSTIVYLFSNKSDVRTFVYAQCSWAFLLSVLYLGNIITHSREFGQHYNTVALPITLGLIVLFSHVIYSRNRYSILAIAVSVILILSLLALGGRGPFIGVPIVFSILGIAYIVSGSNISIKQFLIIPLTFISVLLAVFSIIRITDYEPSELLTRRLERTIEDPTSESRIDIYFQTIEIIITNPIGYGIGTFQKTGISNYPHNIFLHAFYSGGWVSGLILIGVFAFIFRYLFFKLRRPNFYTVSIILLSYYMAFIFFISYSIHNSYMLFTLVFLTLSLRDLDLKSIH